QDKTGKKVADVENSKFCKTKKS
ncbi:MAG: hypothetical protein QG646_2876, partial [Euryarchaeota archaeon]|nr:hypothetical protein [Euryarchaeota archaeon]